MERKDAQEHLLQPGAGRPPEGGSESIQQLLIELAAILLPAGYTPHRFNELTKLAFVRAAADIARFRNGKINFSKVAVLTGLTRQDVRKLLAPDRPGASIYLGKTRLERVVHGWLTDRNFSTKSGNPKILRVSGTHTSFMALVRKYGGDVPHRAVLDELCRLKVARLKNGEITLSPDRARRCHKFPSPLIEVLPALIDGLRAVSKMHPTDALTPIHQLMLPARDTMELAFMKNRAAARVGAMLDGLKISLMPASTKAHRVKRHTRSLAITVFLVERSRSIKPRAGALRSQRGSKN